MKTIQLTSVLACTLLVGCAMGSADAPLEVSDAPAAGAANAGKADALVPPKGSSVDSGHDPVVTDDAAPAADAGAVDDAGGGVDAGAGADTAAPEGPKDSGAAPWGTKDSGPASWKDSGAPGADTGTSAPPPPPADTGAPPPPADAGSTAGATYVKHELTFYGYPDNSPPGAGIALPRIHSKAGGVGTYADPVTFATAPTEFAAGTILYIPMLQKYVIMEDTCTACTSDWSAGKRHIDVWMNSDATNGAKLLACQDSWTRPSVDVEISPPPTRPVSTVPLFDPATGVCQKAP